MLAKHSVWVAYVAFPVVTAGIVGAQRLLRLSRQPTTRTAEIWNHNRRLLTLALLSVALDEPAQTAAALLADVSRPDRDSDLWDLRVHAIRCLEVFRGIGDELGVAGMIDSFHSDDDVH